MKILQNILEQYKNYEFIDIQDIVEKFWIIINYFDFQKINWVAKWNFFGINKNLGIKKQRFIIAHELCHFLLNEKWASTGFFSSCDIREKRADIFATDLLLPTNALIENWEKFTNIPTLSEIFWVPEEVVEYKLKKLF